jgi:hypothetical protein
VDGLNIAAMPGTGRMLRVCPALQSGGGVKLGGGGQAVGVTSEAFSRGLASLARQCVHLQVHATRACSGTAEEQRGERGVFFSTVAGESGVIKVGDVVTVVATGGGGVICVGRYGQSADTDVATASVATSAGSVCSHRAPVPAGTSAGGR